MLIETELFSTHNYRSVVLCSVDLNFRAAGPVCCSDPKIKYLEYALRPSASEQAGNFKPEGGVRHPNSTVFSSAWNHPVYHRGLVQVSVLFSVHAFEYMKKA